MKNVFLFSSILCLCTTAVFSQCISEVRSKNLESGNPGYSVQRKNYEAAINDWVTKNSHQTVQTTVTIPVVVHVVWHVAVQNIADSQVVSQIDVLNEDYGRYNADAVNTPAGFLPVAANTGIQFCLAQVDPQGNPTTGIDRVQTSATSFTTNDNVKHTATAGATAWDPTRYLNIWVCNLSNGLLGYAEFPTTNLSQTFGVVIQYNNFGRVGTLMAPFDNGRTCTHEIAHCFNLYHIAPSSTCVDNDQVSDTPPVENAMLNSCPTYPLLDACNPNSPGVMFMNYMTNAPDDNCMNMFTTGQALRMNAVLNVAPYNSLVTSTVCTPLGINNQNNLSDFISIFPNPSKGVFSINLKSNTVAKIVVYDMLGNVIEEHFPQEIKNEHFELDLSTEANGVYFLQIITSENKLINKKIILSN